MESHVVNRRSEPALKLKKSPLVLVLTQLRFPTFLHMGKCVGDIQDSLRKLGLIRFTPEETQELVFGPEFKQRSSTRWVFSNRARTEAIVLANNFIVYEVSQYDSFDKYLARMLELLTPVHQAAELVYSEQIGMRYVDLLRGTDTLSADEMVCESLRGLNANTLGLDESNYQFVIQGVTPHGTLSIRSFENTGAKFLPPDLQTEHLSFGVEVDEHEQFRVIDFDHIHRGEVDFEGEALGDKLWSLHDHTDITFRQIVTEDAINHWKGDAS